MGDKMSKAMGFLSFVSSGNKAPRPEIEPTTSLRTPALTACGRTEPSLGLSEGAVLGSKSRRIQPDRVYMRYIERTRTSRFSITREDSLHQTTTYSTKKEVEMEVSACPCVLLLFSRYEW